jgi:hypothetical protein
MDCDGKECTREEICQGMGTPMTDHKDYIYGLTSRNLAMNCWPETQIAFLGQLWFIGFLVKILAAPLLEKYGHMNVVKKVIMPMNILSFTLIY